MANYALSGPEGQKDRNDGSWPHSMPLLPQTAALVNVTREGRKMRAGKKACRPRAIISDTLQRVTVMAIFLMVLSLSHSHPEVLALKQKGRILGQWSNPVAGLSKSQASSP